MVRAAPLCRNDAAQAAPRAPGAAQQKTRRLPSDAGLPCGALSHQAIAWTACVGTPRYVVVWPPRSVITNQATPTKSNTVHQFAVNQLHMSVLR